MRPNPLQLRRWEPTARRPLFRPLLELLETRVVPTIVGVESQPLQNVIVGTFTGPSSSTGLTAVIDWGDTTTSMGTIVGPDPNGVFSVLGTHTYLELPGQGDLENEQDAVDVYSITATVSSGNSIIATVMNVANIREEQAGVIFSAQGNFAVAGLELATDTLALTGTVATFSALGDDVPASAFKATIDWGDGTTSTGMISGTAPSFTVIGTHTYAEDGDNETGVADVFPVTVTISGDTSSSFTVTSRAYVAEESLPIMNPQGGFVISAQELQPFTAPVATFTSSSGAVAGEFTASIDWGDPSPDTSAGTISGPDNNGVFTVTGSHTYAEDGTFTIKVTITGGVSNTATAPTSMAAVTEEPFGGASPPSQGQVPTKQLQASVQQVTDVPLTKTLAPDSNQPGAASNDLYWRLYSSHGDQVTDLNALAADDLALALQGPAQ